MKDVVICEKVGSGVGINRLWSEHVRILVEGKPTALRGIVMVTYIDMSPLGGGALLNVLSYNAENLPQKLQNPEQL